MRVALVLMVAGLAWILAACSPASAANRSPASEPQAGQPGPPRNDDGYVNIRPEQLFKMLEDKDFVLVNVHIPYEGELPKTDLFIPFDEIEQYANNLPDKGASIVLYCRSGRMSTEAAETLVRLGYSHVHELDGGFDAWQASGYELLHKP